ncbi:MAG: helix-turn-helix domain-containing protein [Proteocatella sp.]
MSFGEKLRKLRKNSKITQGELASKLNITTRTLINYESGKCYPKQTEIYASIASMFDVSVDYLISDSESDLPHTYKIGACPLKQAQTLVSELTTLFEHGNLCESDKDAIMKAISSSYWETKNLSNIQ